MAKKEQGLIKIDGNDVRIFTIEEEDFVSLTDVARGENPENPSSLIGNWIRLKDTLEFLGLWEQMHNKEDFNLIEFDKIRNEAGSNRFGMSAGKWISLTNAKGIQTKAGRYGATFAHKDIALGFCYWLNPKFQLYMVKEFQRLKETEANTLGLEWNIKRIMAKATYPLQTEAVREHLIPPKIKHTKQEGLFFASEADVLNMALFGITAKQWRLANPKAKGNIRDNASHEQLLVLSVLQGLNAKLIEWGSDTEQRLELLNKAAIEWMEILLRSSSLKQLPGAKKALPAQKKKS